MFQSGVAKRLASAKWSCVWLVSGEAGYSNTCTVLWLNPAAGLLKGRFPSTSLCKSMLLIDFSLQPTFLLQMWEWVLMLQIQQMILEMAKSVHFFHSQIMQFSLRPTIKKNPLEKNVAGLLIGWEKVKAETWHGKDGCKSEEYSFPDSLFLCINAVSKGDNGCCGFCEVSIFYLSTLNSFFTDHCMASAKLFLYW